MKGLLGLARAHGRLLLVVVGVAWSTLSMTALLAFGTSMDGAMTRALLAEGLDFVLIRSGAASVPFEGLPAGRRIQLSHEDAEALVRAVPGVRAASTEYSGSGDVEHGAVRINARVHGVDPEYRDLRAFLPQPGGRFLDQRDRDERRRVAVLGHRVARRVFGDEPPVGRMLSIWGAPFTVVGVRVPRRTLGNYNGEDQDKIMVPSTTFRAMRGWRTPTELVLGLTEPDHDRAILRDVYEVMGRRHGFDPGDRPALGVNNRIANGRQTTDLLMGTRIFIAIMGVLGMLVAIIGVANVLYVMAEEDTRAIGIEMAVGERPARIERRHLMRALAVVFTGGAIGIALTAGVLWLWNQVPMDAHARDYLGRPVVSLPTALAVVGILGLFGCAAGYYPARRAARVDPIEALHHE